MSFTNSCKILLQNTCAWQKSNTVSPLLSMKNTPTLQEMCKTTLKLLKNTIYEFMTEVKVFFLHPPPSSTLKLELQATTSVFLLIVLRFRILPN